MSDTPTVGVILAGGRGTRMDPLSDLCPKPLLPVGNVPIIEHQIAAMRAIGIREVVVVLGHLGHQISEVLGDGSGLDVRVRYVDQGEPRGIAHALAQCEALVHGPMLVFLGDIYFVSRNLADMLDSMTRGNLGGVLAVKQEPDVDAIRMNYVAMLSDDGRVRRVIEKPRHPQTQLKGCGLYLLGPAIFDAIRRTPRSALRDEYEITDAIQVFIDDGHRVEVAEVIELDVNMTNASDLWNCNMIFVERAGGDSIVHSTAVVEPGAQVESCVIGPGAHVGAGVSLRRCLLLPGARVLENADNCVVSAEFRVPVEPRRA